MFHRRLCSAGCQIALAVAMLSGDGSSLHEAGWRQRLEDEEIKDEEEAPTHINTRKSSQFLVLSTDKLSAKYVGPGQHGNDVGAVQGNRPALVKRLLYYFEISVKDRGLKGTISIGFTDEQFKRSRQPGWEPNSYGYHGDDGHLYHGYGRGDPFGPTFTTGDTVGAGINYASQEIFFTKNGKLVGTYVKDVKCPLYPTIGLHSFNERVEVNFGQRPFVFDLEALAQEERERQQKAIENVHLSVNISHSVVRAYLLYYGYKDTLVAFDAASGNTVPPVVSMVQENGDKMMDEESYALDRRRELRQLIRNGKIDGVFSKLQDWYPQLLEEGPSNVKFVLHCQKFIELVKAGPIDTAVAYAQKELAPLYGSGSYQNLLQDCISLLAYEHPAESPVGYLLKLEQREAVSDAVNAAILVTDLSLLSSKSGFQSALEKLLCQLSACHVEKRILNGGQGEIFSLHQALKGSLVS